ncbi:RNA polymerase sigma-70 factor, ECF subfamily [Epilithonimonas mollis]|uniref:RNA polymerase sigma-70 factor, ECF subfamily n=2 Tax=Epilithonimonas mollis TaxID=216903 RepID=A0A1M6S118_9FLAO|nr:RNA polymerase sigma-70 factor, ECF subfamily [Epilithonimonas mollis]
MFLISYNFKFYALSLFIEMKEDQLLALIIKARKKDQKAQTQLINTFWVDVFSFVMNRVKDENDADEITVSVFSKVLNKLDLFDPNFQFKTWILTIAQNTIIDFWRRKNRENEDASDGLENVKNEFARSPEELMISEEDQQKIIKIIETMDAKNQDIIRLRFFEEKSIKEIAEELNLSIANTKVRIMRAKKILAELLKNDETDF